MGFFDGGAKSISYGKLDDNTWLNRMRGGPITNISDERVQTDWKTGVPNPNGKTQVIITVVRNGGGPLLKAAYASDPAVKAIIDQYGAPADERTDPSDDGRGAFYVKGNMRWDIGNKLRELGVKEPLPGGELYLIFTGTRPTPSGDGRTYVVLYFPPASGSVAGGFYDQGQQGQQVPQQSGPPAFGGGAPAQQPAAPPADPWGATPAAQQGAQPPFGGAQAPAPQAGPAQSSSPWG